MGLHTPFVSLGIDAWTGKPYHLCSKKSLLSFGIVILLILAMASERLMFKAMVDRMQSYRYFLCQLMTFLYIPPLFCIVGYKSTQDEFIEEEVTEFPKYHFFVMGILDLLYAMMLFIAGGNTEPMQTLLLMQASIPLTACLSAVFYRTSYSRVQLLGNFVMAAGLVVAFLPSLNDFNSDNFEDREVAWNTLVYLLAAVPGALSMLYKERAIRDQPMDMIYLNAWVTVYQFIVGLMVAPVVFDADVLHLEQKMSGLECLINGKNEVETDHCELGIAILLIFIFSNVLINFLLLQVLRLTSVSVMNVTTILGFVASFVVLAWYELDPDDFGVRILRNWFSSTTLVLDFIAFVAIVVGKILYQWEPDPDTEATTRSAEDKEAQSLLNELDYGYRYT
ncbi:hypothetical protein Poli38472_006480 [Pythium oligandrum]|uniref:Drug/Metabolite Transporter (DMT) Superfamily n=1 Tax=Pythium oligandrum TaxID=41045 RepID=A0A8K1C4V4_PYTOL|nr:hypothetical protein Poli38472_006480 [Pythium oligandrum]|eukprot:TMW56470.1 hypothetical protein Poli38472_006480 [Pythium oligandrum]